MKSVRTAIIFLFFFPVLCGAQEKKILSFYDDNYVTTGPSLRDGAMDIKFQLSLKVYPITINPKWEAYFAYTQTTVWNAYDKSAPFKDNLYRPGVYFEHRPDSLNTLRLALEHRSNGRPYFGNPLASEGYDDFSRGMNYVMAEWLRELGCGFQLDLTARAGVSAGVGPYPHNEENFTQDLFLYYLGYFDAAVRWRNEKFSTKVSVTPVYNRSVANVRIDFAYRFLPRWPAVFAQFHYGFDEAMCDCAPGNIPPVHFRVGIKL